MKKLSYALFLCLIIAVSGCGDDSSSTGPGTDLGQAPTIPDLTQSAQPDISFFEDNNPQGKKGKQVLGDPYANYTTAQFRALSGSFFAAFGQLYLSFLNPAYNESAEFKDGLWEWSYNYSAEGQSGSMRFTAKEEGDSVNWEMLMSFDDGQGGGYDNYNVMEGTSSKDGSQGQWTFNALDGDNSTQVAVAKTEWITISDTQRTITTEIYSESSLSVSFNYEQNGAEHTMIFGEAGTSDAATVFWNTDTRTGYVIEDGNKMCWDENLTNVPCS